MLKYINFLPPLFLLVLLSCSAGVKKEVTESYRNGNPKLEKHFQSTNGESILIKEIQYYENGNKRIEGAISDGKRTGIWMFWFEHGSLWREVNYLDGAPDGITTAYHENGEIFYQGNFLQGKKQGEWSFYDIEGNLINQIVFEYGTLKSQTNSN